MFNNRAIEMKLLKEIEEELAELKGVSNRAIRLSKDKYKRILSTIHINH